MKLTKHAHACVVLTKPEGALLIDPGSFAPNAAELLAEADAVLITHEHFDHVDGDAVSAALSARPGLQVFGPAGAVAALADEHPGQVHEVADGDHFQAAGFDVRAVGDSHAVIHADLPPLVNVGYVIDGSVYHPGDSYHRPGVPVEVLLLPTSGPWAKLGDAVEFVRAVAPRRAVQIHEAMLSELGQRSTANFLSPQMLSATPLEIVEHGETIEI